MARYIVTGYTGPHPDFSDVIHFDGNLAAAFDYGDPRYNADWNRLKRVLLASNCDSEYLAMIDACEFESRQDLADHTTQFVAHAEAYGCDNCQGRDGDGCGDNTWKEGCNDEPHGGYLLTFDFIVE